MKASGRRPRCVWRGPCGPASGTLNIGKQGNGYLRRTLYLGAKARLGWAKRNPGKADPKLLQMLKDKPFNVAAIALANKMARMIWALIMRGGTYSANHRPAEFAESAVGCR